MRTSIVFLLLCSPLPVLAQTAPALQCTIAPARASEADRAFAAGNPVSAEQLFTTQLATAPTPANYAGLVTAQLDQNHLPEALATAQRAAAALPASADAQALVGHALARAGQVPEAFAAYTRALALDRCSSLAHAGLGRLDDLIGRHASAIRELNFAHRLAPNDPAITVTFIEILPPAQRSTLLHALLASHPLLPPGQLDRLTTQQSLLDQGKSCTATEAFTIAKIELLPVLLNGRSPRGWGLKLSVNNITLPLLELDSSVAGIVLNPTDAAKAGVHPLDPATAKPGTTYTASADHIRIGVIDFHNCPVTVAPAAALANANSLIGTSFFRDRLIHIDYAARLLTLSPLPSPAPGAEGPYGLTDQVLDPAKKDWTPVYIAGPQVLVPTLINKKGPYLFAMDTGVTRTIYSPAVTRRELSESKDATLNLTGTSAAIVKVLPRDGGGDTAITDVHGPDGTLLKVTRPVKLPVLRFALSEIPDPSAVSFDLSPLSHQAQTEISGVLGFSLLSYFDIEINYRDALARIAFDQNRRYHVMQADEGRY